MSSSNGKVHNIELSVPARPEFVRLVRLVMAGIGNSLAFNVEEIEDIKMAVSEAFNMFHPSSEHPLEIRTAIDAHHLTVEVCQRHDGRDNTSMFAMDNSAERPIGIMLMQYLMDEVEYKNGQQEMQVRLIKNRQLVAAN
jgi:serine/threonine-protein kinase RsbW